MLESTQLQEKLITKQKELENVEAILENKKLEYHDATKTLVDLQQEHDDAIKNINVEVSSNIQYIQELQIVRSSVISILLTIFILENG